MADRSQHRKYELPPGAHTSIPDTDPSSADTGYRAPGLAAAKLRRGASSAEASQEEQISSQLSAREPKFSSLAALA